MKTTAELESSKQDTSNNTLGLKQNDSVSAEFTAPLNPLDDDYKYDVQLIDTSQTTEHVELDEENVDHDAINRSISRRHVRVARKLHALGERKKTQQARYDDHVGNYLELIGKYPLLTKEEEYHLGTVIQRGREADKKYKEDKKRSSEGKMPIYSSAEKSSDLIEAGKMAEQSFYHANLRLAFSIARRYHNSLNGNYIALMDLVQEANIGLLRAVDKFEPKKGFRFSTYATGWIKSLIGKYVDNKSQMVNIPQNASIHSKAVMEGYRDGQSIPKICQELGISEEIAMGIVVSRSVKLSLNSSMRTSDNSEGSEIQEIITDVKADEEFNALENEILNDEIIEVLKDVLKEEHVNVLAYRLGLVDGTQYTDREVAEIMQIPYEIVRKYYRSAIERLRTKKILPYILTVTSVEG